MKTASSSTSVLPKAFRLTPSALAGSIATLLLGFIGESSLQAATYYWDGGTANIAATGDGASGGAVGNWSTALSNWDQGSGLAHVVWPTAGTDNDAVFAGTAGVVTLQTAISANDLTFNTTGYTIARATTNVLTLNGTTSILTTGSGISATISSVITGVAGTTINKAGAGTLILSGANTFAGPTTISAGTLKIGNAAGLGTQNGASDGTTISAGATLDLGGIATGVSAERLTVAGTGVGGNGAIISSAAIATPFIGVRFLTLAGDTTLGFANRWDVGSLTLANGFVGGGYTLNVLGTAAAAQASLNFLGETDLGDINVNLGTATATNILFLQGSTTLGRAANTVTITGSVLNIFSNSTVATFDKKFALDNGNLIVARVAGVSLPSTFTLANANNLTTTGPVAMSGAITGTGSLTKLGASSLTLSGANNYDGATTVSAGTLVVTRPEALYNADASKWTAANLSFATGTTLTLNVGGASDFSLAQANTILTNLLTVNNNGLKAGSTIAFDTTNATNLLTLGRAITDSVGTAGGAVSFAKLGAGTLTLDQTNTYTGATTVGGGTLNVAGGSSAAGAVVVGNTTTKAVLNLPAGGTLTGSTITAGTVSGAAAAVNISGGTLTMAPASNLDTTAFGVGDGAYGAFTMSSGSFTQQRFMFGGNSTTTGSTGVGLISGGTVNTNGWLILGRSGPATGILTITGGTINRTGASNVFAVGLAGTGRAELNVAGGLVDNTGQTLNFSGNGTFHWTGTGVVNLNAGTLVTNAFLYDAHANSAASNSYINFSGGTLKAGAASTAFLPAFNSSGAGINRVYVRGGFGSFAGGATIDTNGFDDTIAASLLAPTGSGVTALSISDGGSGYVGAPAVKILDNGVASSATAYAVVGLDPLNLGTFGKVTGVVITNPGEISGTATVSLLGGGGSGAVIAVDSLGANTSGGLIKTGLGTLTLTGTNTYTGLTSVNQGGLTVAADGSLSGSSGLAVSSGARFSYLPSIPGSTLVLGAGSTLNLADNSTIATTFGSGVAVSGAATIGGVVKLALSGSFNSGQAYTVLSAASGLNAGANYQIFNPTDFTFSTSVAANSVQLTPTAATPLSTAYWRGGLSGSTTVWAASTGIASNWTTDGAGTATGLVPGAGTNVFFSDASASAGNQLNMILGTNMAINSLTVNGTVNTPNSTSAISLLGTDSSTLTLGSTSGAGLTVNAGSGPVTLNATIALGTSQTWTNQSSNPLTLAAVSNGANALTIDGSGSTVISAFNGGSGSLTVNAGATSIGTFTGGPGGLSVSGGSASVTTYGGTGALTVNGGAANVTTFNSSGGLTVNGGSATVGAFNSGATGLTLAAGTATLTAATLSAAQTWTTNSTTTGLSAGDVNNGGFALTITGTGTSAISGVLSGAGALTKTGSGTLTLSGASTYTGATTVNDGKLVLSGNRTAALPGNLTVGSTSGLTGTLDVTGGDFTYSGSISVGLGDNTVAGIVNQSGGSLTSTNSNPQIVVGTGGNSIPTAGTAATGTYNLSGGTLTGAASNNRGIILGVQSGSTGIFNLSGTGVLAMGASAIQVGRTDSTAMYSTGVFNQTGGTATVGFLGIGGGGAANNAGTSGTLNLTGGTFTASAFTALGGGNSSTVDINIGGTAQVILPAFPTVRGSSATTTLNFDGGTLSPLATSGAYISNLTNAFIKAGGATFNVDAGKDINIPQALLTHGSSLGGGLTKQGLGSLALAGADNTYTGATVISAGTLTVSGSLSGTTSVKIEPGATLLLANVDVINNAAGVNFAGGLFDTGGFSEGSASSPGLGNLSLTANSTLDFGAGISSQLWFAGLGSHVAGSKLSILNWSGTNYQAGDAFSDRLVFAGSVTDFTNAYSQADISFNGFSGYSAINLGGTAYEIVAIPEPSSWTLGGLMIGLLGWRQRRRGGQRTA